MSTLTVDAVNRSVSESRVKGASDLYDPLPDRIYTFLFVIRYPLSEIPGRKDSSDTLVSRSIMNAQHHSIARISNMHRECVPEDRLSLLAGGSSGAEEDETIHTRSDLSTLE